MYKVKESQEFVQYPCKDMIYQKIERKIWLFGIRIFYGEILKQLPKEDNKDISIRGFSFGTSLLKTNN